MAESYVERSTTPLIILAALFAVSLTSANFLSSKLFEATILGLTLVGPAGVVAYSATFLATDIVSEVYGKRAASQVVKAGFLAQLAAVAFTIAALATPAAPFSPVDEATYKSVVWAGAGIIVASLTAYLASQLHDVWAFHYWKGKTGGRWLWLRNNASTLTSQLIDTVIFITLAFHVIPALTGGNPIPLNIIATMIYSQYIIKAAIAVIDTPLVYLGVALTRSYLQGTATPPTLGILRERPRLS